MAKRLVPFAVPAALLSTVGVVATALLTGVAFAAQSLVVLAISIARTHSLVPRIHGVNIESYSQLYPLLIAPFFRHGLVPHNVETVHQANAWIMSSACIPAFFLARRVTGVDYSPALFARMNQDLAFDDTDAIKCLGYAARPFRPSFPPL